MTCKDCKSRHTCTEPHKSYEYEKDGDSWANWCDDFDTIHEDKTVVKDGLRIVKSGYNFNIMVFDDETDKLLFDCICQDEMTIKELYKQADFVKNKLPKLVEAAEKELNKSDLD